jgi:hypothetical protein
MRSPNASHRHDARRRDASSAAGPGGSHDERTRADYRERNEERKQER